MGASVFLLELEFRTINSMMLQEPEELQDVAVSKLPKLPKVPPKIGKKESKKQSSSSDPQLQQIFAEKRKEWEDKERKFEESSPSCIHTRNRDYQKNPIQNPKLSNPVSLLWCLL